MRFNRALKPLPADEYSFTLPEIKHLSLENGLKVLFVERHNLPILRINLVVDGGSRVDPADKKGLAYLFAMMIDEGAGNYNALELNEEFELLGSNFDASCDNDTIYLSLRTLKENFDRSLELISTIIKSPHFKDEAFKREQRKLQTRLIQLKDDPDEIANYVFDYLIFGDSNPYAFPVIGNEESVDKISIDDIKDFYHKYMAPNNASLIAVGDITEKELIDKLNNNLKDWEQGHTIFLNSFQTKEPKLNLYLIHREGSVQSEIRIGHISSKRNKVDYFPKMILNSILGGQFSSRINLNLRENKGYTYGAFSNFFYFKEGANFMASTSVSKENTANAVKEILKELDKIRDGVLPNELDFAKSALIRKFPSNFETNRQIASSLTRMVVHSLPDDHFNTYISKIKDVNIETVNQAAVKNIFPDKLTILIVGDKYTILKQLSNLNLGKVIEIDNRGNLIAA